MFPPSTKGTLLIIGAGPYGLAMAALARHLDIEHAIVGKPFEGVKQHSYRAIHHCLLRSRSLGEKGRFGCFENGDYVLARDGRKVHQEVVQGIATLQIVEERLDRQVLERVRTVIRQQAPEFPRGRQNRGPRRSIPNQPWRFS